LGRLTRAGRAGLGLGLAISRGIVEAHGGDLRARSEGPGKGSTIEIDLLPAGAPFRAVRPKAPDEPAAPSPPEAASAAAEPSMPADAGPASGSEAEARPASVRVLVVDDHEDSAETLALLLRTEGYVVRIAHTVREAESQAAECDVLISDIALP